jgi:hypothetical protein
VGAGVAVPASITAYVANAEVNPAAALIVEE